VQHLQLLFTIFELLGRAMHEGNEVENPTVIKGTKNHAKTSSSTKIFDGTIISVVQYLAPLRYLVISTGVANLQFKQNCYQSGGTVLV
jgi:hypothetical protein